MTKQPFRDTDLMRFEFVAEPQLSPDGRLVAYVRTTLDEKKNAYRSQIFVVASEGGTPQPFTAGLGREGSPRWSPDGHWLAFVTKREDLKQEGEEKGKDQPGAQLYLLPTTGGEARRLTHIKSGVGRFVWSPDGRKIAFTSRIKPEGPEFLDEEGRAAPAEAGSSEEELFKKFNEDVRHITRIHYRLDGFGWFGDKRSHVFVLDVAAALAAPVGKPVRPIQVTHGDWDHDDPVFSPDGRTLAVTATREEDADYKRFNDIYLVNADGTGQPRKLTASRGPAFAPSFSPDGRTLAYLGHTRPYGWYSDARLWLVPTDGSAEPRCLTPDFARSFGDQSITDMRMGGGDEHPAWSSDGRSLYLLASDRGTTHLYQVDAATGSVSRLTSGDWVIFGLSVNPAVGKAALAVATAENPNNIYSADLGAAEPLPALSDPTAAGGLPLRQLTRVNEELLAERRVALPERFTFHAEGGPEVDGWAIKPLNWQPGKKYPTLLEIHGGPMAMYTGSFFFEFQLLAAAGMGVIFTNPRGSQGYGEVFCGGIKGDWGNHDYQDLMAGTDAAIARFDWIDPERMGVLGGSYGGYMTSWIIGHTQRFQAACAMRSVTNCYSFFGTSDGGYMWDEVWGGGKAPWEAPEEYLRQSPIAYAGNMRTPTLVIHSEEDYRCLVEQDEQLYTALKKQHVDAEFLRYPGESHGLSRSGQPWHRVHRLRHIVHWFVRYLQPEPVRVAASAGDDA